MYRVIWYEDYTDKTGKVIHDISEAAHKLATGIIKQELGSIPTFTFTATLSNPSYAKLKPLISLIKVINIRTGTKEFEGRVRKIENLKMDSSGNFTQAVQCVGFLDYLHDSSQRFKDVSVSNLRAYLETIINRHNQTVQPHKRFTLGEITVSNNTGNVYRGIGYEDTFDTIKDKLIDRLGGNLILRNQNGEMILDYIAEYGVKVNQPIKVARNMIEVAKSMNSDELITRIVPTGAEIEKPETDTSILARERYTIGSVNGGKDYIDDEKLIEEFGIIEKSVNWSDTKQPSYLKTKGEQYLRDQRVALVTWGVTTVNLDLLDDRYQPFELGNYYPIDNKFISDVTYQQIVEKTIDINQPHKIDLVLGSSKQTLSAFQLQFRGFSDELDNAKQNIDNSRKSLDELKAEAEALREIANRVPEQEKMLRELEAEIARQEQANKEKQNELETLQATQGQIIKDQSKQIEDQAKLISDQEKRIKALEDKK
ncbi:MAG TPA: hypothetical protein DIW25_01470 [Lactococcus garvieae]|uniref:phage tail protein n=1 Tax=Lactococcus garvieae TaxID=1363 RepID=UPI000EE8F9AC|nr:phage tail protein [Lactococcus garvieae]HCS85265.1 hypothetical protein [Lactococcus garvieae]